MKKILSLIMVFALCLPFVSCGKFPTGTDIPVLSPISEEIIDNSNIIFGNSSVRFDYTEDEYSILIDKINSLESRIKNSDDAEAILSDFDMLEENEIKRLSNQCSVASILMSVYSSYEKYSKQSTSVNEKYNTVVKKVYSLYKMLYDNEKYKETFFADWEQKDIDYMLKMSEYYTDKVIELEKHSDQLKEKYYALLEDEDFKTKSGELYMEVIETNKQIAKAMGYDNYMDYAYEYLYGRDYSPEDTDFFKFYVKKYIVPSLENTFEHYKKAYNSISPSGIKAVEKIVDSTVSDFLINNVEKRKQISDYLDEYFGSLDNEMYSCYEKLKSDRNYIIASDPNISNSGAFTTHTGDSAVCYFGPEYQSLYTFIHEYGHYHAISYSDTMNYSLDLHEVQSQGNEWLFTSFLSGKLPSDQFEYIYRYNLLDALCIILRALSVNEFEKYVYTHDGYTAGDLDGIMADILKEMGAYDIFLTLFGSDPTDYWHYVTTDNPGYYISYAVSLVPALDLYYDSVGTFDSAAKKYIEISRADEGADFRTTLVDAGMIDPFAENAFLRIKLLCE